MAIVRTFLTSKTGKPAAPSMRRVDAERWRLDWHGPDGVLLTSQIMLADEAARLAETISDFLAPAPPVDPVPVPVPSMPPPPGPLTWHDAFDSGAVPSALWGRYSGPGHRRHGLRLPSTWSVQAVEGANGMAAVCEAKWVAGAANAIALIPAGVPATDRAYLVEQFTAAGGAVIAGGMSARTDGVKFGQLYGRFECRARFAPDPSGRMSGLALLWPQKGGNLEFGELDFAESLHGTDPHRHPMYAFMHWPGAATGNDQTRWVIDVNGDEWNTYTLDWFPDRLVEYVNGREVGRETDRAKIPSVPFTPCLQLDCFDNRAIPRQRAEYDYFSVWRATP